MVSVVCLMAAEVSLRKLGYVPHVLLNPSELRQIPFRFTDTAYVLPIYYADSMGLMKIDSAKAAAMQGEELDSMLSMFAGYSDFILRAGVNSQGFRGHQLVPNSTSKKRKVLLLGDSFTWGYSAKPLTNCFADLLQVDSSFMIYNAAVPGCDVATYKTIVDSYVALVKPQVVVMNFYAGNDAIDFDKQLVPYQFNDVFTTNAGALFVQRSDVDGDSVEMFNSAGEAHGYYLQHYTMMRSGSVLKSLSGSALFCVAYRVIAGFPAVHPQVRKYARNSTATANAIADIDAVCKAFGSKLVVVVIPPDGNSPIHHLRSSCDKWFGDVPYHLPENLTTSDYYEAPDGHFNNSGHAKYAAYLQSILKDE